MDSMLHAAVADDDAEPRAQPNELIRQLAAGQSRRLTSGGEAVARRWLESYFGSQR